MRLQHESYANQKLQTEWGVIQADAEGCIEAPAASTEFFVNILKFKTTGRPEKLTTKKEEVVEVKAEAPVVEQELIEPEVEEKEEKKKSQFAGKKVGKK